MGFLTFAAVTVVGAVIVTALPIPGVLGLIGFSAAGPMAGEWSSRSTSVVFLLTRAECMLVYGTTAAAAKSLCHLLSCPARVLRQHLDFE